MRWTRCSACAWAPTTTSRNRSRSASWSSASAPCCAACSWRGVNVDLTVTEFLILKSLALRPGHVKSRDQLMDGAYGEHIYVDDRTIDSHIKRLRKKFKAVDSSFGQIETLYGVGYRYRDR